MVKSQKKAERGKTTGIKTPIKHKKRLTNDNV